LVGLLGDGTPLPMMLIMFTASLAGNLIGLWLLPRRADASTTRSVTEN
jgi:DHA1 family bicyclomycin/chloramphenicol resistance-like MFS transporter